MFCLAFPQRFMSHNSMPSCFLATARSESAIACGRAVVPDGCRAATVTVLVWRVADSASGPESSGSGGGGGEPADDCHEAAGWRPGLARAVQLLRDQLTTSKACDRRL